MRKDLTSSYGKDQQHKVKESSISVLPDINLCDVLSNEEMEKVLKEKELFDVFFRNLKYESKYLNEYVEKIEKDLNFLDGYREKFNHEKVELGNELKKEEAVKEINESLEYIQLKDNHDLKNSQFNFEFKNKEISNSMLNEIMGLPFNRVFLINLFLDSAIKIMKKNNISPIAKGLEWILKEIHENFSYQYEKSTIEYFEKIKDSNQQLKSVYEWIKEYSTMNDNQNKVFEFAQTKYKKNVIPLKEKKAYKKLKTSFNNNNNFSENQNYLFLKKNSFTRGKRMSDQTLCDPLKNENNKKNKKKVDIQDNNENLNNTFDNKEFIEIYNKENEIINKNSYEVKVEHEESKTIKKDIIVKSRSKSKNKHNSKKFIQSKKLDDIESTKNKRYLSPQNKSSKSDNDHKIIINNVKNEKILKTNSFIKSYIQKKIDSDRTIHEKNNKSSNKQNNLVVKNNRSIMNKSPVNKNNKKTNLDIFYNNSQINNETSWHKTPTKTNQTRLISSIAETNKNKIAQRPKLMDESSKKYNNLSSFKDKKSNEISLTKFNKKPISNFNTRLGNFDQITLKNEINTVRKIKSPNPLSHVKAERRKSKSFNEEDFRAIGMGIKISHNLPIIVINGEEDISENKFSDINKKPSLFSKKNSSNEIDFKIENNRSENELSFEDVENQQNINSKSSTNIFNKDFLSKHQNDDSIYSKKQIVFEKIHDEEQELLLYSNRKNNKENDSVYYSIESKNLINKVYAIVSLKNKFEDVNFSKENNVSSKVTKNKENQNYLTFDSLNKNENEKNIIKNVLFSDNNAGTDMIVYKKIIDNLENELCLINSKDFNIFDLQDLIGQENVLPIVSLYIFSYLDFFSFLNKKHFENFIYEISRGYIKENKYHNDIHGTDVEQSSYIFMTHGKIKEGLNLTDIDCAGFLIASIIHDFKHPGVTNAFLVNTQNLIALTYNDNSVLENYHVAEAFKIMVLNKNCNIFSELSKENFKVIRKRIIELVLATDMTMHAKELNYIKSKIEMYKASPTNTEDKEKSLIKSFFEKSNNSNHFTIQQEFLNIIIHMADISNPTKPNDVYVKWTDLVMNEFWMQGDREKSLNIPISFLCDRVGVSVPKAQIGFMDGIVQPLLICVIEFFPDLEFLKVNLDNNKEYYKDMLKLDEEKKLNKE